MQSLSHNEVRELQTRLNSIEYKMDIMPVLPMEILLRTVQFLDLEDYVAVCAVSPEWSEAWRSELIVLRVIKIHFRTQWEQTDREDAIAKQGLIKSFPKAAEKRIRKQSGQYISMCGYLYPEDGFLERGQHRVEHQYDSGRVAYTFRERIVVQSLNKGLLAPPKIFADVNRTYIPPGKWLLSNDLLIAQT